MRLLHTTNRHDGTRIAFSVEGDGPPLLLLHGSTLSSLMWHHLGWTDLLRRDYQLILPDLRGHGGSDRPHAEDAYDLQRFVDDLDAVLDALEIDRALAFGYSLGARVLLACGRYASDPARFTAIVAGGGTVHTPPGSFDRATFPGALSILDHHGIALFLTSWEQWSGVELPAPVRASYLASDQRALVACLRRMEAEPSIEDGLARLRMPVLLFAGERDPDRLAGSQLAAERLPNAELLIVPGATHVSAIAAGEPLRTRLTGFLARHVPASHAVAALAPT